MKKEILIKELQDISKAMFDKKDFISAGHINRAIDVIESEVTESTTKKAKLHTSPILEEFFKPYEKMSDEEKIRYLETANKMLKDVIYRKDEEAIHKFVSEDRARGFAEYLCARVSLGELHYLGQGIWHEWKKPDTIPLDKVTEELYQEYIKNKVK